MWLYIAMNNDKIQARVVGDGDFLTDSYKKHFIQLRLRKGYLLRPPTGLANKNGLHSCQVETYERKAVQSYAMLERIFNHYTQPGINDFTCYWHAEDPRPVIDFDNRKMVYANGDVYECMMGIVKLMRGETINVAQMYNMQEKNIPPMQIDMFSRDEDGPEDTSCYYLLSLCEPNATREFNVYDDNRKIHTFVMKHGHLIVWHPKDNSRYKFSIPGGRGRHVILGFCTANRRAVDQRGQKYRGTPKGWVKITG